MFEKISPPVPQWLLNIAGEIFGKKDRKSVV
jgi:hypothetical protein